MKNLFSKSIILICLFMVNFYLSGQTDPGGCDVCPSVNSSPCVSSATSWFLGGNNIIVPSSSTFGAAPIPPLTDIGTCNEFPFILKANNKKSIFIQPNSYVGIGFMNSAPTSALDVRDGISPSPSNFRIYADAIGNLESTTDITMNYAAGKTFAINEGPVNNSLNRIFVQNGKVGINNASPVCDLDIKNPSNAEIRITSQSNNSSNIWTINGISSYNFGTDYAGIGHIGSNSNNPTPIINFKYNSATSKPQVWIGKKPTTGQHTDFALAVEGKVVANSIYVTLQGNWADYVFDKNYKMLNLKQVETFYKTNHHLPEIPSEEQIKQNGIDLAEMNKLLLKKVEELTIYLVDQQKQIDELKYKLK